MRSARALIGTLFFLGHIMPTLAQSPTVISSESDSVPQILGAPRLLLHQKFEEPAVRAAPSEVPPISPGDGYATVTYSIGTSSQRKNLTSWIQYLATTLPATIGNSSGTYVVALRIKGADKHLDLHEPIIAIQWTTERAFLFFDKTVNDVKKTEWAGTFVDEMRIAETNRKLQFSVEISFHKDRSLDFEFLKQASKTGTTGALVSLLPLPAASLPMIDSVASIVNSFYTNSTKEDVINSEEIEVTRNFVKTANLPIQASNGTYNIPINLQIRVKRSRLVDGGLVNGKFDRSKISQTLFEVAQVVIAEGKTVSLAELIATAADDRSKKTRAFLDALQNGGAYSKDDLSFRCGDLLTALDSYVSKADARAAFWAFLQRYSVQIDRDKCLGSGTLRAELASFGLSLD
jgi:hypothetical protein